MEAFAALPLLEGALACGCPSRPITMVMGLEGQPQASAPSKSGKAANASIQNLVGKEGSEVTVQWRDENGAKMATHINVTQVSSSKNPRNAPKGKTKGTY